MDATRSVIAMGATLLLLKLAGPPSNVRALHKTSSRRVTSGGTVDAPTKAVYICTDQPATLIFRLRQSGGPYIPGCRPHDKLFRHALGVESRLVILDFKVTSSALQVSFAPGSGAGSLRSECKGPAGFEPRANSAQGLHRNLQISCQPSCLSKSSVSCKRFGVSLARNLRCPKHSRV